MHTYLPVHLLGCWAILRKTFLNILESFKRAFIITIEVTAIVGFVIRLQCFQHIVVALLLMAQYVRLMQHRRSGVSGWIIIADHIPLSDPIQLHHH